MVTLNTTFQVEEDVHLDFLAYLKHTYISEAKTDKLMSNARLCKVHAHIVEEGHSYSVQFTFESLDDLETWDQTMGKKLNEELLQRFTNRIMGFSTLLEEIDL
ncbi:MAG TPA: DUF4286 family protein [Dysgonamonadaceae bacterium]|nr:DUF4286 family protein [Dysgonamonadaceae bacterium]